MERTNMTFVRAELCKRLSELKDNIYVDLNAYDSYYANKLERTIQDQNSQKDFDTLVCQMPNMLSHPKITYLNEWNKLKDASDETCYCLYLLYCVSEEKL